MTDAQLSDLARIRRSRRHLLGLIDDVPKFARVEAGHGELSTTDLPLGRSWKLIARGSSTTS